MFEILEHWIDRRRYREGRVISRFIARDVRRDVLVVSVTRINEGVITCRVRTWNVLYLSRGLVSKRDFEPATELRIEKLWDWTGGPWGGCRTERPWQAFGQRGKGRVAERDVWGKGELGTLRETGAKQKGVRNFAASATL